MTDGDRREHQTDASNQPYGGYPPAYAPPRHPDALTALVLGGASLVVLPVLGPFAWYIGAKAAREMAAQPGRWSGEDLARIGMICGIIGTALCAMFLLFVVLLFVVGIGALGGLLALGGLFG